MGQSNDMEWQSEHAEAAAIDKLTERKAMGIEKTADLIIAGHKNI